MNHIVLTEEQERVLAEAGAAVEVRDTKGNWLGRLDPTEAEIVAEIMHRRVPNGKRISAEKVEEHLHALQAEWERLGGFDRRYMTSFLEKLRSKDEK